MLKKIWDFLFYSCRHEWKIISKKEEYSRRFYPERLPEHVKYVLQCKKCGNIQTKQI